MSVKVWESVHSVTGRRKGREEGEGGSCIQEEAENLPHTTAMPEGAEYRREQRLERERGEAGGDCCLAERSGGVGAPAWGGRGPKQGEGRREKRHKDSQRFKEEEVIVFGKDKEKEERI